MFPLCSGILAEATGIKRFLIVFLLYLCYTFITNHGRKSNKERAKSNEQQAKCNE